MSDNRTPIRVGFYDIEKTIGKGNFAVVKLARHRLTKNEVAIKIIDKTQLQPADLRRAYREVRVLKKLYHPHIIRLYQVMETKNMLYLVTEYAPKGEIFEHIANHGRLPEPFARRIYWQVVSAVDYCHKRGVVHRDLKAENLLFDAEGCVKLADFGFSTWWSQDQMLSTWCGSPPYAAPEVFEGRQYVGPEIDIWSLGVVLYVLVCGALPFDASTLPALRERVLSARYRIPYFMSAECESLVRNMLKRDPQRRFTIDQVKQHAWMQADRPPRLLPAPGQPTQAASHKQYLDPGLAPDVLEPNEQILRLMASLGIDSSRTKESLKQQSYDHHAAIYFLLLERLRQHPGGKLAGSSIGRPAPGAVRMMSTDSSTCRKMPRRPSTVAEAAMRKMGPGPSSECQPGQNKAQQAVAGAAGPAPNPSQDQASYWRAHRAVHAKVGQSQNSSVDEGVADMDSTWEPDFGGSISGSIDRGSTSSSGFMQSVASASGTSRTDWKWPAAGCSGYSIPTSSDSPRASGSPGESVHGSSTTLSSWDSAWEPASVAMSLPSCSQQQQQPSTSGDSRRISMAESETARSPESALTTGRLWMPEMNQPLAPEFQLGRRASDGLIGGRRVAPFTNKLDGARAGGITTLTETDNPSEMNSPTAVEEGCLEEKLLPDSQFLVLCSPAKRPSLPDTKKVLPNGMMPPPGVRGEPGTSQQWTSPGTFHLHKQLMSLRLQRRAGGSVDIPDIPTGPEPMENTRRSVLRQQSYKLAQQQPVMSPLHGQNHPFLPPDLESCIFRPICPEESRLHSHEEEQEEEDDEETHMSGGLNRDTPELMSRTSPWPGGKETAWQTLPVTMGDCKLTDSNTSLSRLSPLLQYGDFQPSSSNTVAGATSSSIASATATTSTGAYTSGPFDWNKPTTSAQTFLPPTSQSSLGHPNILPRP